MSEDQILKCLIAFVLGFLVARMMRGNGLMVGGEESEVSKCKYSEEQRCCARIWDSHYGTRCRYKRNKTDYCNHHNNMIKRTGKLYLNRYDEDKPIFDEKGNRFPWLVDSNIEILNNIILKQEVKLKKLINKNRQIAPKI